MYAIFFLSLQHYNNVAIAQQNIGQPYKGLSSELDNAKLALFPFVCRFCGYNLFYININNNGMKKETVTRNDLRSIKVGETVVYELPNPKKCMSVRAMTSFLKKSEGKEYTCSGETLGTVIQVKRLV